MCGYCTEKNALLALQDGNHAGAPTEQHQLVLDVYLEEVGDLPNALLKFSTQTMQQPWVASIILCRAIDVLVAQGFDSAAYQSLLRHPQFTAAILAACAEKTAELNDKDTRINARGFAWLADRDTDAVVKLTGQDGNAFVILGLVRRGIRRSNHPELEDEFMCEAKSGDYDHLLQTCIRYVNQAAELGMCSAQHNGIPRQWLKLANSSFGNLSL